MKNLSTVKAYSAVDKIQETLDSLTELCDDAETVDGFDSDNFDLSLVRLGLLLGAASSILEESLHVITDMNPEAAEEAA